MPVQMKQTVPQRHTRLLQYVAHATRVTVIAVVVSLPVSMVSALVYRFPFFAVGARRGLEAALDTPVMWLVWMLIGGIVVFAVLGCISGVFIVHRVTDMTLRHRYAARAGVVLAVVSVLLFASADLIFGLW